MASVRLPWDIQEEILSRLPPHSLLRFRTVCQSWNALFNDKSFLNNHLSRSRPQFIFQTISKIYSIHVVLSSVDPTIDVRELPSDLPFLPTRITYYITACDGLLFRDFWKQGVAVWNPCLRQVGWIKYEDNTFRFRGVGYDRSRPDKGYKILGCCLRSRRDCDGLFEGYNQAAVFECASRALKFIDAPFKQWATMDTLSVKGNLYWLTHDRDAQHEYFIRSFDFSTETFKTFCPLPCQKNYSPNELVLAVFEGDRFSLLKQCFNTSKVEVWVTKKKIDDREEVVWINLMTFPTSNLPNLVKISDFIRYFIFDKTLVLCCGDGHTGDASIYIVREDMCKKIRFWNFSVFSLSLSSKFDPGSFRIQIAASLDFGFFLFCRKSQLDSCVWSRCS